MAGSPLKRYWPLGRCESLNRRGTRCGCRMVFKTKKGRFRCKYHGGMSTGPKTAEGKARVAAAALRNLPELMRKLRLTPSWRKHLESSDSETLPPTP